MRSAVINNRADSVNIVAEAILEFNILKSDVIVCQVLCNNVVEPLCCLPFVREKLCGMSFRGSLVEEPKNNIKESIHFEYLPFLLFCDVCNATLNRFR